MHIFYRISDKSHPKLKLPGASKKRCFQNLLDTFDPATNLVTVMADNCSEETYKWICNHPRRRQFHVRQTNLGNAGTLLESLRIATKSGPDYEYGTPIYFVEDDYLHQPDAKAVLFEGAKIYNYVTLYDHPDKYTAQYNFGETSVVRKGPISHWRQTISTCMTFGTTIDTLHRDYPIWEAMLQGKPIPPDHQIFTELYNRSENDLLLGVCIPGRACHTDMTYSGTQGEILMEPWAIKMMIDQHNEVLSQAKEGGIEFGQAIKVLLGTGRPPDNFDTLTKLTAIVEGLEVGINKKTEVASVRQATSVLPKRERQFPDASKSPDTLILADLSRSDKPISDDFRSEILASLEVRADHLESMNCNLSFDRNRDFDINPLLHFVATVALLAHQVYKLLETVDRPFMKSSRHNKPRLFQNELGPIGMKKLLFFAVVDIEWKKETRQMAVDYPM